MMAAVAILIPTYSNSKTLDIIDALLKLLDHIFKAIPLYSSFIPIIVLSNIQNYL